MVPFVLVYFRVNVLENANSKNASLCHSKLTIKLHILIYNIEVMLLTLF